jgi:hypothetical protein
MENQERKIAGIREPIVYFGLTGFFLLFAGVVVSMDVMSSKILPVRLHDTTVIIGAVCVAGALATFHMATNGIEKKDDDAKDEAPEAVPEAIQQIMVPPPETPAPDAVGEKS